MQYDTDKRPSVGGTDNPHTDGIKQSHANGGAWLSFVVDTAEQAEKERTLIRNAASKLELGAETRKTPENGKVRVFLRAREKRGYSAAQSAMAQQSEPAKPAAAKK